MSTSTVENRPAGDRGSRHGRLSAEDTSLMLRCSLPVLRSGAARLRWGTQFRHLDVLAQTRWWPASAASRPGREITKMKDGPYIPTWRKGRARRGSGNGRGCGCDGATGQSRRRRASTRHWPRWWRTWWSSEQVDLPERLLPVLVADRGYHTAWSGRELWGKDATRASGPHPAAFAAAISAC